MGKHIFSRMPLGRQKGASDSVPPDPEHDAGWEIWDCLSGYESQPHQFGGSLCRFVGYPNNCKIARDLKIESRTSLNLGR